jgi:ferredoxin
MAQIDIHEKSCRGCELCVDECPTKVFEYDREKCVPVIARKDDCIECLSCYFICPSAAISLEDIEISKELYRDLSIREKMTKFLLSRTPYVGKELTAEDYELALTDMFVRIQAMSDVYHHIAGKSLPALGTSAGQAMARNFPNVRPINSREDALRALKEVLHPAWALNYDLSENNLKIKIEDCFVRESCQFLKRPLGENLCVLFGSYMMGYLYDLVGKRLKILNVNHGSTCIYEVKIFE